MIQLNIHKLLREVYCQGLGIISIYKGHKIAVTSYKPVDNILFVFCTLE